VARKKPTEEEISSTEIVLVEKEVRESKKRKEAKEKKKEEEARKKAIYDSKVTNTGERNLTCTKCGKSYSVGNKRYSKCSEKSIFSGIGFIPVCKTCIRKIYLDYLTRFENDMKALYHTLQRLDVAFYLTLYQGAKKRVDANNPASMVGYYLAVFNSTLRNERQELTLFEHSDPVNFDIDSSVSLINDELALEEKKKDKLSRAEKRAREDIIKLLGNDPFDGFTKLSKRELGELYRALVPYLEDDSILNSQYRLSVVMNIISINSELSRYNRYLSLLTYDLLALEKNQTLVGSIQGSKNKLISNLASLTKDNKWLTETSQAGTRLTQMMQKYSKLGFEDAEVDFFSERESKRFRQLFDISNESIMSAINFSDDDMKELFKIQRELIDSKDSEITRKYTEATELAKELKKYKKLVINLGGELLDE